MANGEWRMANGEWRMATIFSRAHEEASASATFAAASVTCSQLSSTMTAHRPAKCARRRSISGVAASSLTPQCGGVRRDHTLQHAQRCRVEKPDAVGKGRQLLIRQLMRQLKRQARLVATADADQGQQAHILQPAHALHQRRIAANAAGARQGQVVRGRGWR